MKFMILVRGLPGAGKSTFAKELAAETGGEEFETDDFFMRNGKYEFDANRLGRAHKWNESRVRQYAKKADACAIVANTFTTKKEMQPYVITAMAEDMKLFVVAVKPWHGKKSVHDVPAQSIERMANRWQKVPGEIVVDSESAYNETLQYLAHLALTKR